jgi:signal transduction histidine kinase
MGGSEQPPSHPPPARLTGLAADIAGQHRGLLPGDEARGPPGGYLRVVGSERDMSHTPGDRQPGAYPAYPGSGESSRAARPPLTKRMRLVHWIALDCVIAGLLAIITAAAEARDFPLGQVRLLFLLLFLAAVFIPVALRRRAPVTAFGALVILGVLMSGLAPSATATIFLAAAYVLYTVTVEGRRRTGAAALGLMLAVLVFVGVGSGAGRTRDAAPGVLVPVALASVIAWMTGYSVRQRRLYVVTLQQQAANSAVAEERLRIARELHDVVAHSMSVIAVQAGYGQYVIDASPGGAKDALGAIQATSRDALEEMRRMLGVLRQQDVTPGHEMTGAAPGRPPSSDGQASGGGTPAKQAPLAPAPGMACLDRLIGRTRGAGVRVTLEIAGHSRPAPAGVDLSAYRIIQEALTNVVRHAGTGASCVVSVGYTDADLVIRVTDDGGLPVTFPSVSVDPFVSMSTVGTGHGIIGMRERVHLCGGTFSAGPLPNGGFQVTAALPLPAVTPQVPPPAGPLLVARPAVPLASGPAATAAAAGPAGDGTWGTGDGARAAFGAVAGDGGGRG